MNRRFLIVAFALGSALAGAPWLESAGRPKYGGTLRVSFSLGAESLDPSQVKTPAEQTISRAVYETLVELDERGMPAPGLAVSWSQESGGKRWIFNLRPGVRFHNGSLLTAAAARAALERAAAQAPVASPVVAPVAAVVRLRRVQLLCASPSPSRLACDTAEPLPLPALLSDPALAISDPDGAGTGPFKIASFTPRARVRLEAFEAHWRGRPFLDAVEAEFSTDARRQRIEFELKRADVLAAPATEARPPETVRSPAPLNVLLLAPGATARGRDAARLVNGAADREALARLLPPGVADPADALLPGWLSGYDFLFAAERPRPAPGAAATFRLAFDDSDPVARLIASRLALDLRAVAVTIVAEGLSRAALDQSRQARGHDLYLESVRIRQEHSGPTLADLLMRAGDPGATADGGIEAQYRQEVAAIDGLRLVPLLHYRDRYSFQPGLDHVRLGENGLLDLANSWRK